MVWSPDGRRSMAVASLDGSIHIWDTRRQPGYAYVLQGACLPPGDKQMKALESGPKGRGDCDLPAGDYRPASRALTLP